MLKKEFIEKTLDALENQYPEAKCALNHKNNFELICAVCLSAQTTDKSVNIISKDLFFNYPTAFELANADIKDIEEIIKRIGMYRNKAKNLFLLANELVDKYNGQVPDNYDELIKLAGVGRKTANVVLSVGFGHQRIAVDTHVFRVANRIGLVKEKNVLNTELSLMEKIPEERWTKTHHSLIFHGRNCCSARSPECGECILNDWCEKVGVLY